MSSTTALPFLPHVPRPNNLHHLVHLLHHPLHHWTQESLHQDKLDKTFKKHNLVEFKIVSEITTTNQEIGHGMIQLLPLHQLHVAGERGLQVPTVLTAPQVLEIEDNILPQLTVDPMLPCIHLVVHQVPWSANTVRS